MIRVITNDCLKGQNSFSTLSLQPERKVNLLGTLVSHYQPTVLNVDVDAHFTGVGRVANVLARIGGRNRVDQEIRGRYVTGGIGLHRNASPRTRVIDCLQAKKIIELFKSLNQT